MVLQGVLGDRRRDGDAKVAESDEIGRVEAGRGSDGLDDIALALAAVHEKLAAPVAPLFVESPEDRDQFSRGTRVRRQRR
jgi:hypothetical protein